jgi:hypothetical protein
VGARSFFAAMRWPITLVVCEFKYSMFVVLMISRRASKILAAISMFLKTKKRVWQSLLANPELDNQ